MDIKIRKQPGQAHIALTGRFDFHAHRDFRRVSEAALEDPEVKEMDIDFARVDYIDSSALGMLLLLRDKADGRGVRVVLSGVQGTVKQVLDIANFGKLFTLRL
jgi:anti-anti-sigma factor